MEEGNGVQVLEKISSEVDESQIKVILSSQCIKAQTFLLEKLKKQSERYKETCSFISSANLKVETEIKQAEQEIRSMLIAQATLQSANVEIKKEWLLAKNRKADITEHVNEGIRKYEAKWSECKTRYESIPFVKKLLQSLERQKTTDQAINDMDKQITKLYDDMEIRRQKCAELDIKRAVEVANFLIRDRPKAVKIIKEKIDMINYLTKEIELLMKDRDQNVIAVEDTEPSKLNEATKEEDGSTKHVNTNPSEWEDDSLMPKLELVNFDLDIMDVNLEQVKLKKDNIINTMPTRTNFILQEVEKNVEHEKTYEYMISPYFTPLKEDKTRNFSEKKLINILEDININSREVYHIVKNVNPEKLRPVGEISGEVAEHDKESVTFPKDKNDRKNEPTISEKIEEIDLTSSNVESIIIPPTQFLDITLSDDTPRKRVCFDLSYSMQINEIEDGKDNVAEVNVSNSNQLDVSTASDESLMKMKQMVLKKHNLDLSPQFVYAKNNVLQKKDDDKIITSKFFETRMENTQEVNNLDDNEMEVDEQPKAEEAEIPLSLQKDVQGPQSQKDPKDEIMPMDEDKTVISTPQSNKISLKASEELQCEKTVAGLLFRHGIQDIPDSLNVSLSTNGYEDSDFPHCFDSSLLLSPKADVPANGDNHEILSQEVPNFLSGFRKAGLSFFGGPSTSSENKPESNANRPNEPNNFSFNFGGDNKNRGGLFSLFR